MNREIERKYLVLSDAWRDHVVSSHRLRDATIPFGRGKVRIRVTDERAWVTFKGPRTGISRAEFEYSISHHEAEELLRELQPDLVIKTRHCVPVGDLIWSVDVHEVPNASLVTAEIELQHEDQTFVLPRWVGRQLTAPNP